MCSQTVLVDFGCWFRVAFGLVMGFVLCEFGGLMDSGFGVRILGFVRDKGVRVRVRAIG